MKLIEIQQKLKAPKGQFNAFGKYKYRSCEDILEAVKPHLSEPLQITDEIIEIGGRVYVKATVTYQGTSATGFAREAESKKGMDEAQLTGACSSYARKYALSALLLLDDTKDADSNEASKPQEEEPKTFKILSDSQFEAMLKTIGEGTFDKDEAVKRAEAKGFKLNVKQIAKLKEL